MKTTSGVRIGLAGWSEAVGRHRASFPAPLPAGCSALAKYAAAFDFVEINASFYRQFRTETYAKWAADVPDSFRFAVKMHRLITHYTRLKNIALLEPFFDSVAGLGDKLSVVLVQLPPSLAFHSVEVSAFFDALRALYSGPVVCEPRHDSWKETDALTLLADHRIGLVQIEIPEPLQASGHDGIPIYVRLHGAPRRYYSAYSSEQLARLARFLRLNTARERFVVFDNTAGNAAVLNGLELLRLVSQEAA